MTLIIALVNHEYAIHLSDRRLSKKRVPTDDEANKATLLECENGRFAIAFTGIAQHEDFRTQEWLLKSLAEVAAPDYAIGGIIARLQKKASHDFKTIPALTRLPAEQRRLSILFSGYRFGAPPLGTSVVLTNYDDYETHTESPTPWDEFKYWVEPLSLGSKSCHVWCIGNYSALPRQYIPVLQDMLSRGLPATALIQKGVEIIREAASGPKSQNTIGKQVTSIVVPSNFGVPHVSRYHTNTIQTSIFIPSLLRLASTGRTAFVSAQIQIGGEQGIMPIAFPKAAQKALCPCGSGKKYKHCHGHPKLQ